MHKSQQYWMVFIIVISSRPNVLSSYCHTEQLPLWVKLHKTVTSVRFNVIQGHHLQYQLTVRDFL